LSRHTKESAFYRRGWVVVNPPLQIQSTKVTKIGVCGFHPFDLT